MATPEIQDSINDYVDQLINSKRMKLFASSASQLIEQTSVTLHERELSEDSTVRVVPVTEKEGCDLAENQAGTVEEGRVLEDGCNEYTVSKRRDQHDGHDAFHNSPLEISSDNIMMPQHTCGDETQPNLAPDEGEHNLSVDEFKGASEHCAERTNGSPSDGSLYKISSNEEHNFSIDEEEISEDDESIICNYRVRVRSRGKQFAYPETPESRRQKVPWTAVEEKQLMVGVKKFSSADGRIFPWKKILEFDGSVFLANRTTTDLKDKWRNMSKGTSKPK